VNSLCLRGESFLHDISTTETPRTHGDTENNFNQATTQLLVSATGSETLGFFVGPAMLTACIIRLLSVE